MKSVDPKGLIFLKTMNLYLSFLTMGMCKAVPGPCLLDFQSIVNTDTQHIAFIYTANFIGYLIGSILGGILLDCIKSKQVVMTLFIFIMSSSMIIMPFSRSLGFLMGLMVINGFSIGTVDTGGNVLCLTLWKSESGPFYQALHFCFGVGSFAAPLIAAPYLSSYNNAEDNATFLDYPTTMNNFYEDSYLSSTENETFYDFSNKFNYSSEHSNRSHFQNSSSDIIYPFSMIGGFGILVTILFLGTTIASPTERKVSQRSSNDNNVKSSFKFLLSIGVLNVLLLFSETGTEIGYAQMLTTYVVKGKLQLSPTTGSYMTSAFWAAFALSRLIAIFLAIKISSFTFILIDLAVTLLGSVILLFLSSCEWAIWTASIFLGAGIASFFPAAIGWLNCYITVTNKVASIFIVGASLGGILIPLTISYFIETFPDILIYIVPLAVVLCCLVTLILHLILRGKEKKHVKKEPEAIAFMTSKINI